MGLLVDGVWHDQWYDTESTGGRFERDKAAFRNWVTADGSPGPQGKGGFKAEPDRYHLYVAYACPWANRALIFRKLKGLEEMIPVSVVNPLMRENGWTFQPGYKVTPDPIHNAEFLHQVYTAAKSDYTGRVTVPVLWDKQENTIVSNESADIIRMFNSAFDEVGAAEGDYYPEDLREEIDAINETVYNNVNNGVYKAGFATAQHAYEEAVIPLFETLDELEARLDENRYLCGSRITEADWCLFTTLIRFDAVYVGHFKCNIRRIEDYPNLSNYLRELYQVPGISETVDFHAIKLHYYGSHDTINPNHIVPIGPALDFHRKHDRERLPAD
ncbi:MULTISPECIES: glutathione S-transferase family protein [unclassified Wenzhouxiangella]|uniref:glutathione S-transferase family protein n=1 Tax=unclassified Wenzhouxiangella TaxID=2613841 RepID=UPI000E328EF6|nr:MULTISPECIES: glutathione S-transferase family protein [unclassified Wenzhouxiangella]RFF26780.1 glutathione S-transferase family protein [Wenzhouxiangella sp. 15181]RFP67696.1 glutathione S-transferase family protein [Wenzhouxiangella sp. 15190]